MNTNTKHTPQPWNVMRDAKGNPQIAGRYQARHVVFASLHPAGFESDEQMEATAVLIAAAPELLEAARYALDCATHKRDGRTLEEMAQRVRELLTSAIAKAEGR